MYECVISSKDNQVCRNVEKEEIPFSSMMKEDFPEEMRCRLNLEVPEGLRCLEKQAQRVLGKQRGKVQKLQVVPGSLCGSSWLEQRKMLKTGKTFCFHLVECLKALSLG